MKVILQVTLVTLAALVTSGHGVKQIPGFTYIGSVTSSGSGIGILSTANLYVQKDMNDQDGAFNGCEAAGMTLLRIPDAQKEDQVRQKMNQAGIATSWTSGNYYQNQWVWDRNVPISADANWFGGAGMPQGSSSDGVYYRIDNRYDFGLDVESARTPLLYICETLSSC